MLATMAEEKTIILKTDVLGRVTMPAEKREALLNEYERSGMPAECFAQVHGVKIKTFASWVQKRKRVRGEYPVVTKKKSKRTLALLEAVVEGKSNAIKIELANGTKIEVGERSQLVLVAELINLLSK